MFHVRVELGVGEPVVVAAAGLEQEYRKACIEALRAGADLPAAGMLPSLVASYIRNWAFRAYTRDSPYSEADVTIYRVPARGWTFMQNGVTFVVCSAKASPITRACAVFLTDLMGPVHPKSMLVLSNQGNGWLASFRGLGEKGEVA